MKKRQWNKLFLSLLAELSACTVLFVLYQVAIRHRTWEMIDWGTYLIALLSIAFGKSLYQWQKNRKEQKQ